MIKLLSSGFEGYNEVISAKSCYQLIITDLISTIIHATCHDACIMSCSSPSLHPYRCSGPLW